MNIRKYQTKKMIYDIFIISFTLLSTVKQKGKHTFGPLSVQMLKERRETHTHTQRKRLHRVFSLTLICDVKDLSFTFEPFLFLKRMRGDTER